MWQNFKVWANWFFAGANIREPVLFKTNKDSTRGHESASPRKHMTLGSVMLLVVIVLIQQICGASDSKIFHIFRDTNIWPTWIKLYKLSCYWSWNWSFTLIFTDGIRTKEPTEKHVLTVISKSTRRRFTPLHWVQPLFLNKRLLSSRSQHNQHPNDSKSREQRIIKKCITLSFLIRFCLCIEILKGKTLFNVFTWLLDYLSVDPIISTFNFGKHGNLEFISIAYLNPRVQ